MLVYKDELFLIYLFAFLVNFTLYVIELYEE